MAMLTLALQTLAQLFLLGFGIAALATTSYRGAVPEMHQLSWHLTGVAFVLTGVHAVLHASAAVWAFGAGVGTVVYDTYLRWAPAGNHSRAVLGIVYGGLLIWIIRSRASSPHRVGSGVLGLLLLAMMTGGAIGWWEGSLSNPWHWSAFAFLNLLGLLVMLTALFAAFLARSMDWHLWLSLLIYSLHLAFHVIWHSALAWWDIPDAWTPRPWQLHMYAAIAYTMMLAVALHRLILARRGVPVASALEFLAPTRFTSLG